MTGTLLTFERGARTAPQLQHRDSPDDRLSAEQRARLHDARARVVVTLERLMIDSVATDYRRGRDPSNSLRQLLDLQELKQQMGGHV